MPRNLKIKALVILGVIVLSVIGVIGLPKSAQSLMANVRDNIRLGLDLRGGSHLILQVQVQDAAKVEAAQLIERLKDELPKAQIDYAAIDRTDPQSVGETDQIRSISRECRLPAPEISVRWSVRGSRTGPCRRSARPITS